jgi:hypothetical protein
LAILFDKGRCGLALHAGHAEELKTVSSKKKKLKRAFNFKTKQREDEVMAQPEPLFGPFADPAMLPSQVSQKHFDCIDIDSPDDVLGCDHQFQLLQLYKR